MTNWSDHERIALSNFLSGPSVLKQALEKYIADRAAFAREQCAACMATVPRDHERASDHAARAAELSEFWAALADTVLAAEPPQITLPEPTLQGAEEE